MLIDLTYHCSMGCTHCLSNCKPDNSHMSIKTLEDAFAFCNVHEIEAVSFSGGEIFEHPEILQILDMIGMFLADRNKKRIPTASTVLITNGRVLANTPEYLDAVVNLQKKIGKTEILLQVTDDPRFYPTKLTEKERYRLRKIGAIVEGVPGNPLDPNKCLYPQGRALENFQEDANWNTVGPKCGNIRLLVKQLGTLHFGTLNKMIKMIGKVCTPVIAPNGDVKVGESALCPAVASIYDDGSEIVQKILNCNCRKCVIPFEKLRETKPEAYHMLISR